MVVQLKKTALAKAQDKIDIAQEVIDGKQRALDRLKADHAKKAADLGRMEELAAAHVPMQQRYEEVLGRMAEMFKTHNPEDGKLQENEEYIALRKESDELRPRVAETLPALKKIYYGKG